MKIKELHTLFLKCNSVCTDTRKIKKGDMFFALKGANFNGNKFAKKAIDLGAEYVIVDEDINHNSNAIVQVSNTLETLQELARFHRKYLNIPIIALTGSNGKTTTKELIHAVLSESFNTTATLGNLNNHIGVPLTLLSMTSDTEIGVVEMGANHLQEIDFLCNIALPDFGYITNFGKAHLEGFGSIEGVINGKTELYRHVASHSKVLFVYGDDPIQLEKSQHINRVIFGTEDEFNTVVKFIDAQPYVSVDYKRLVIKSKLIGTYNFNNIAAAISIGEYFDIDSKAIKQAIENYIPENNRSQIVQKKSIKIILDAYNANPSSMVEALKNFSKLKAEKKIAILGDMFELGNEAHTEHAAIAELANSLHLDHVILIGENFHKIHQTESRSFNSFESFLASLNTYNFENSTILIKGSRGMALERLIDAI